jgi:hypothetical protein
MRRIPLDVTKVRVPRSVILGTLANSIACECSDMLRIKVPKQFRAFIKKHDADRAFDWWERLRKAAYNMPIELLQKWVETLPGGLYRAELRGILKQRG